jgi:hypothetical protein
VALGANYEDSRFLGSGFLNVTAAPSTNVLTTSGSPAVYGSAVILTSTVTGSGATPTGTVRFYEGGNFLGSAALNGSGVGTMSVSRLAVLFSPHAITAVYGGDAAYASSTSAPVAQSTTPATLIASITVSNKVYDATTNASIASVSFGGIVSADIDYVHLGGTPVAFFEDPNVGNGKPVDISGLALAGSLASNYQLSGTTASATANITGKVLTVNGLTATSRIYDGTTNASFTGTPALSGVIPPDDVSLVTNSAVAFFATKTVGTNKTVTINGYTLGGGGAGNYTLPPPTLTANITSAPVVVVGLTANSKTYDGTNTATLSGTPSLSGVVSGDSVLLTNNAVATFNNKNAGVAKPVAVTGFTIGSTDAANYTLSQPTLAADINPVGTTCVLTSSQNPSSLTSNVTFTALITANSPTLDSPPGANTIVLQTNGVLFKLLTPIASVPGASTNSAGTTLLKAGTNTVTATYAGDGTNFAASALVSLSQVVNSSTCGATNALLGIAANPNGTFTLSFLGTPQAQYYVLAHTNLSAAPALWSILGDSTNTVTNLSGLWSYTTTNGLPQRFYRGVSVSPCP